LLQDIVYLLVLLIHIRALFGLKQRHLGFCVSLSLHPNLLPECKIISKNTDIGTGPRFWSCSEPEALSYRYRNKWGQVKCLSKGLRISRVVIWLSCRSHLGTHSNLLPGLISHKPQLVKSAEFSKFN